MINIKNILDISKFNVINIKQAIPQVGYKVYDYTHDDENIFIEDGIMDFIIDINGNLLLGNGHYKLNRKEHILIFAGKLGIKSNKIYYIDNDSGHYVPTLKESTEFLGNFLRLPYISDNELVVDFK